MKYVTEYRDADLVKGVLDEIRRTVTQPWVVMEICGGQTHSIMRNGIDQLLPSEIELVHGPGCPVCVTPLELIDKAIAIASRPQVIFTSYGDMLRVPGSERDLFSVRAAGGGCPRRVLAVRCCENSSAEPGSRSDIFRHWIRDHRAAKFDERLTGSSARIG